MKRLKLILGIILVLTCAAIPLAARDDDSTNAPVKPYPLKTCLVYGMQLGEMGKPCVIVYKGQEIEVCDKSATPRPKLRTFQFGVLAYLLPA